MSYTSCSQRDYKIFKELRLSNCFVTIKMYYYIIADCLKYSEDWVDHRMSHNIYTAIGFNHEHNKDFMDR